MIRRMIKLGTIATVITLTAPAIIQAKTLHIGVRGDLNLLDPHTLNETFSIGILGNAMEGLTRRDKNLRIVPGLATSWKALSPTHWRFFLRKGVRFHDGAEFTADDVLFSMQRARQPGSQMRVRIPNDARFEKIDRHTVDIHLDRPNPVFHYDWDNLYILSKSWAKKTGLEQAAHGDCARTHTGSAHGQRHRPLQDRASQTRRANRL